MVGQQHGRIWPVTVPVPDSIKADKEAELIGREEGQRGQGGGASRGFHHQFLSSHVGLAGTIGGCSVRGH